MAHVKVAVATEDGITISQHFGRADTYLVYDIEDGVVKGKETRPKVSRHHRGMEYHHIGLEGGGLHEKMLLGVSDCSAVLAGGMGWGMYQAIKQAGMKPFLTDVESADEAVQAYIAGTLVDRSEMLH